MDSFKLHFWVATIRLEYRAESLPSFSLSTPTLFSDFENYSRALWLVDARSRRCAYLNAIFRLPGNYSLSLAIEPVGHISGFHRTFVYHSRYNSWTSIEWHFIFRPEIYRLRHHRGCFVLSFSLFFLSFFLPYARVTLIVRGIVSLTAVSAVALLLVRPLLPRGRQDEARHSRREIGIGETSLFATEVGAIFQACPFPVSGRAGSNCPAAYTPTGLALRANVEDLSVLGASCVVSYVGYQTTRSTCYLSG